MGQRKLRVELDRPPEHLLSDSKLRFVVVGVVQTANPSKIGLVSIQVVGWAGLDDFALGLPELDAELPDDLFGHARLNGEDLVQVSIVTFGPQVNIVGCSNELRRDPHPAGSLGRLLPTDGAFEYVADPELLADLPDRRPVVLILQGARAGDDAEAAHRGESAGDLLGHPRCEVIVLGRPKVVEW